MMRKEEKVKIQRKGNKPRRRGEETREGRRGGNKRK